MILLPNPGSFPTRPAYAPSTPAAQAAPHTWRVTSRRMSRRRTTMASTLTDRKRSSRDTVSGTISGINPVHGLPCRCLASCS